MCVLAYKAAFSHMIRQLRLWQEQYGTQSTYALYFHSALPGQSLDGASEMLMVSGR